MQTMERKKRVRSVVAKQKSESGRMNRKCILTDTKEKMKMDGFAIK